MAFTITKGYTPLTGQVADATLYNTDIAALFNLLNGLQAQTSTIGGWKIVPSANSTAVFTVTNAAGAALFNVDTTNGKIAITPAANSTATFDIKNAAGTSILAIDSTNNRVVLNSATTLNYVNYTSVQTRYYCIGVGDFVFTTIGCTYGSGLYLMSDSATVAKSMMAPIHLPHGAIVTQLTVHWNRDDAAATGTCRLNRIAMNNPAASQMAAADSNSSSGYHVVTDTAIGSATIDNDTYTYNLWMGLDPNNAETDVKFYAAYIIYTITSPLP